MQRLYISNKDRIQGTAYDFLLSDIGASYGYDANYVAKVVQVDFENFALTIIKGQNDVFEYYLTNTVRTVFVRVTFPEGWYSISGTNSLLSFIQAAQLAACTADGISDPLTWSYDIDLKKIFLLTNNGGQNANYRVYMEKNADIVYPYQDSTPQLRFIDMLGVDNWCLPQTSTFGLHNHRAYAQDIADISSSAFMDIAINISTMTMATNNLNRMIITRVPVSVGYGDVVAYQPLHPLEFHISTHQLNNLRVTCFNQWNQYYILPDNANLSIVFQLEPVSSK
jgi:hypothetical protein